MLNALHILGSFGGVMLHCIQLKKCHVKLCFVFKIHCIQEHAVRTHTQNGCVGFVMSASLTAMMMKHTKIKPWNS